MPYLSKYGVARIIRVPMAKSASADHAVGADWTPVAGDVKISKDGDAAANVANLPTALAMGNSALWVFSLTATEMEAAQIHVTIADSPTKAIQDSAFDIETYGHPLAQHAADFDDPDPPLCIVAASGSTPGKIRLHATTGYNGGVPPALDGALNGKFASFKTGALLGQDRFVHRYDYDAAGPFYDLYVNPHFTGAPASGDILRLR